MNWKGVIMIVAVAGLVAVGFMVGFTHTHGLAGGASVLGSRNVSIEGVHSVLAGGASALDTGNATTDGPHPPLPSDW